MLYLADQWDLDDLRALLLEALHHNIGTPRSGLAVLHAMRSCPRAIQQSPGVVEATAMCVASLKFSTDTTGLTASLLTVKEVTALVASATDIAPEATSHAVAEYLLSCEAEDLGGLTPRRLGALTALVTHIMGNGALGVNPIATYTPTCPYVS